MKTFTMQLLLQFASFGQSGNDLQEDPAEWLRAIESDLRPLDISPSYVWKRQPLENTQRWRSIVDTAALRNSMP